MSDVALFCCQKPMHECIHAQEAKLVRWYCETCHFEVEAVDPDIDLSVESKTLRGQYGSEIY